MQVTRRNALTMIALVTAAACDQSVNFGGAGGFGTPGGANTVPGSGVLAEEYRAIGTVTSATHSTEGALHVEQVPATPTALRVTLVTYQPDGSLQLEEGLLQGQEATDDSLLVRAEDNLLPYLITEVQGGMLRLRTAPGVDLQPTLPIEFFLRARSVEAVTLSGAGSVDVSDLTVTRLALTNTGVGSVEVSQLLADELVAVHSGVGELRASGSVDRQTVQLSGLGSYRADDLQSREADVLVAGFGSATVRVTDLLIASITSSGSVFYIGSPTVHSTVTGTGAVTQIAP